MLESIFKHFVQPAIPIATGIIVFFALCFMIFFIIDADSTEERIHVVIVTVVAIVVMLILAVILMYVFSIIALIIFILAAIWLVSQY